MNTENTEIKEDLIIERLNEFLKSAIDSKSLAKQLRRANYILATNSMTETENGTDIKWLNDSYFWLHQLSEVLDPNINID